VTTKYLLTEWVEGYIYNIQTYNIIHNIPILQYIILYRVYLEDLSDLTIKKQGTIEYD